MCVQHFYEYFVTKKLYRELASEVLMGMNGKIIVGFMEGEVLNHSPTMVTVGVQQCRSTHRDDS